MTSFRAKLRRDQEETVEKAAKKAHLAAEVTFCRKGKGNEKQYQFNESIQDKLATVALCLEEASAGMASLTPTLPPALSTPSNSSLPRASESMSSLEQAKVAVQEGMDLLKNCQKVIRLADRSKLGWVVVNEYGEDKLAKDSDDEKRMARAVAAAEKKAAQQKKSKVGCGAAMQNRSDAAFRAPRPTADTGYPVSRMAWLVGPCFDCGEIGHLRRNCPKTAASRLYPFDSDVSVYDLNNDICYSDRGSSDQCTLLHDTLLDRDPGHELHLMCEMEGHIWETDGQSMQIQGRLK